MPEAPLVAVRSVRGRRDRLQDSFFCVRDIAQRAGEAWALAEVGAGEALPERMEFAVAPEMSGVFLYGLADGVGGHNRGDLAAQEAARMLSGLYQPRRLRQELEAEIQRHGLGMRVPSPEGMNLARLLQMGFQRINLRLHHHEVPDIRTTLVTVALDNGRLWVANVGDSRLYRLPRESGGGLRPPERLTVDDSHLDRKIYGGEFLPFAPCSYDVASELREHLEQEGRYALEFVFDLTRLEPTPGPGLAFEQLARRAHEEIARILADGSGRLYRRAMQLGVIAPAFQVKDEGILSALGHRDWLGEDAIRSTIRQGRRRGQQPEPSSLEVGDGDLLLMCSDGLTDVLSELKLHELLSKRLLQPAADQQELQSVCDELVSLAEKDEQCLDNISAILIQVAVSERRAKPLQEALAWTPERLPTPRPAEPLAKEPARAEPDRASQRLVQALIEKKASDREFVALLKKMEERLGESEDKLEEMRLSVAELRGRMAGLARRNELLERLAWVPALSMLAVLLLVLLLILRMWG